MNFVKAPAVVAVLCLGLSACIDIEERDIVELHEPGKYLGKSDPLLEVSGSAELESRLNERFNSIQTDR